MPYYPRHPPPSLPPLHRHRLPQRILVPPHPNTYQNTTVITIERARTNITLRFPNGTITVNATQKSLNATTSYSQSYVVFNNTILAFANRDVNFAVDDVIYTNKTANASGFLSFNYTNFMASGSMHTFKWVLNVPGLG
ncbi:MAG: hypothetical protein Q7J35_00510 [Candidatus Methanoperedens sp.]|nr:hypothetical protein [Candidatus Methanoperedens sp.]